MVFNGLDSALSGLRVAQQQMKTISNNVSNVNTPGYTRKIVPQQTVAIEGKVEGVLANPVIRKVDLNLQRDYWTQVSTVEYLDIQASYLNKIQEFHGPPELEISIAAEIAALRDSFSTLADSPEDNFLQSEVVRQAETVANKINDFSELILQLQNDAQDELDVLIEEINGELEVIAELNKQIRFNNISSKTTAALEDERDKTIKSLAEKMEISFFTRGDGVLVVQTAQGVQLADERPETLFLDRRPIGENSYFPESVGGIYVGGDPEDNPNTIDITDDPLNGKIGGLLDLRDNNLPRQLATLDELAHKMALRFNEQGLRLFTDSSGQIPLDTPPDPSTLPLPTPVEYVGFSRRIQVSDNVIADNTLIQQGTVATDLPVQEGSNEVIERILEHVFTDNAFQQVAGTVDLRSSAVPTDLQNWLGIYGDNQITGTVDMRTYSDITTLMNNFPTTFQPSGPFFTDELTLTFEESRAVPPLGPTTVTVSLDTARTNFPIGGAINNAADQLIAEINNQITLSAVPPELAAQARLNGNGQIIIESRGTTTIDADFVGGMGDDGLGILGLTAGTVAPDDPYIDVQIGNATPERIHLIPGMDETDFINALEKISATDPGVPGLALELDAVTGELTMRPGDDFTNPRFGGKLRLIGGPFTADGSGTIPAGVTAGTTIVEALFGNGDPVENVEYASLDSAGDGRPFRNRELGPGANISTGILTSSNILEYAQKLVNQHAAEINRIESLSQDEGAFRDLLQERLLNESGVNLDEELSHLIVIQTAYSAAARVISAIDEQFRELIQAF